MQRIIEIFKQHNLIKIIDEPLDVELEIPHLAYLEVKKQNSKALLFTNPVSKRLNKKYKIPVLMNVFGSFQALNLILGKDSRQISDEISKLLKLKPPSSFYEKINFFKLLLSFKNVPPKTFKKQAPSQETIDKEPNLYDLPILKTWEKDAGAFITMGQVYTKSLDGKSRNLGMYRLQVYSENKLGMHWQIHKDGTAFFNEYKKAGKKMPVSVAIGGDPLYIWCAQAPLPEKIFELLLYGFIRKQNANLVKSVSNDIEIPYDADIVIEGFVDTNEFEIEGPFGDHTGYYTPPEPYPVMTVSAITSKKEPIYQATVVGKPPLEDKYMGYATERIFLPLLQTTTPDLIDYHMPENGVFHNLILAKMKTRYPYHAKQFMHAFWGVGQMSFVKHAIFVGENAPSLEKYEEISDYILNRINKDSLFVSEGICDALDHASPNACFGGKLGVDCTGAEIQDINKKIVSDDELLSKVQKVLPEVVKLKQYKIHTKTPICVMAIKKEKKVKEIYEILKEFRVNLKLMFFYDEENNNLENLYMLIWRTVNNIDALRDIFIEDEFIAVDATKKTKCEGYLRQWPDDTECNAKVLEKLEKLGLINQKEKGEVQKYV